MDTNTTTRPVRSAPRAPLVPRTPPSGQSTRTPAAQGWRAVVGAMVFDVDGVIADTARMHTEAWRRVAIEEGIPFDNATGDACRGLSRADSLRRIIGDRAIPEATCVAMMKRKNDHYRALLGDLTENNLLPGVAALLRALKATAMPIAAVSASRNARLVLDQTGVAQCFDCIVDGRDEAVGHDLHRYLRAASRLRVEPRRCVVIEDAAVGIAAARQFGMRTIGVGPTDRLGAADLTFDSLRGVDAALLLRWLGGMADATTDDACDATHVR